MKSRLLFILSFVLISSGLFGQITSIGIIGSATPGGWDNETPLTQVNDSVWTIQISLIKGEAKFRANNAWDINWGAKDFPTGTGVQGGPNIPVFFGDYTVFFNSNSGEYIFDVDSDISIIGSATAGGWDKDTKMYPSETDSNKFVLTAVLLQGEAKFRTTGSWDRNWGAIDFPTGTGTQGGPNIPIAQAGKYDITFDSLSGEYAFAEVIDFASIGIIGSATPGGWDNETPLTKSATNPDLWRGVVVLIDGEVKFRANNSWDVNWGGSEFPSGTGVPGGDNIAATAGEYIVTFNTATLAYTFLEVVDYGTVGLIGSATPGGWDTDTPMNKDAADKTIWKIRVKMVDGEAKFRADNDWAVNWGGTDFPEGIAEQDGPNLQVPAGDYFVDFNSATGAYKFTAVVEYGKISLVGKTGPFGEWPGADDSKDTYLDKDPADFNHWTHPSVTLTSFADVTDGGVKFRAEAAWTNNWGAADFPSGVGVPNGPNIQTVAGTYRIDFRTDTGDYAFLPPSSTYNVLDNSVLHIYPNPTKDFINIEVKENIFEGAVKVTILNTLGQIMSENTMFLNDKVQLPVQNLNAGQYIVRLSNDKSLVSRTVQVVK